MRGEIVPSTLKLEPTDVGADAHVTAALESGATPSRKAGRSVALRPAFLTCVAEWGGLEVESQCSLQRTAAANAIHRSLAAAQGAGDLAEVAGGNDVPAAGVGVIELR